MYLQYDTEDAVGQMKVGMEVSEGTGEMQWLGRCVYPWFDGGSVKEYVTGHVNDRVWGLYEVGLVAAIIIVMWRWWAS